ncbi:MAG: DUF952 domain-containing protein, partial [Candidatus Binataceae bacterium]
SRAAADAAAADAPATRRRVILHIARRSEWDDARTRGAYRPSSFERDGFIHCSTVVQATETANRFFHGQRDLVLLCIDERKLTAPLRYEPAAAPAGGAEGESRAGLFPHLYGPLNLDAVTEVQEFLCAADGSFEMPARLRA